MEKNTKNDVPALGAETTRKPLSEDEFKKMVSTDLKTAVSFLMAILNDEPTIAAVNEYLYGRYLNQLHAKDLEAQTKLPV